MKELALTLMVTALLHAQGVKRPAITGLAHVALYVKDIEKSRAFYKDFLGYSEPFSLNNANGTLSLTFIKINDRQYIELFPETEPASDRLHHISIETTDAESMRRYLASRGVRVPERVPKGRTGNSNFNIKDPDGHTVEIVQYEPDGWSMREKGRFMTSDRISERMLHAGILVGNVDAAMKFYRDLLGFRETWRGSRSGKTLDWINLRVPEGTDYIEFMLYSQLPPADRRGVQHHICLERTNLEASVKQIEARPARKQYDRPIEIRTGTNRRRQANLFDPDGTRVELMEPDTIDGVPVPSSSAPPPYLAK
jgi:lactoylglutathione lyase